MYFILIKKGILYYNKIGGFIYIVYGLTIRLHYPTLATTAIWRGNNTTILVPPVCAVTPPLLSIFREIEARTNIPQFFFRHGVQILQQKAMVET